MHARRPIPALGFDALTPLFDQVAEVLGFGRSFKQKILAVASIRDEVLLDIGCGTGTLLVLASQQGAPAQAIGIDIDASVLAIARTKVFRSGVQAELIEAGAQCLPLADASIDVAVSSLIFHHLPTALKRAAMHDAYRVLRADGRFVLVDFGPSDSLFVKVLTIVGRVLGFAEIETLRDNRAGALPTMLQEAGFVVSEVPPRFRSVVFLVATKEVLDDDTAPMVAPGS